MHRNEEADAKEARLWRLAFQLMGQLPESPEDAATVLRYATELNDKLLKPGADSRVVRLHSIRREADEHKGTQILG